LQPISKVLLSLPVYRIPIYPCEGAYHR